MTFSLDMPYSLCPEPYQVCSPHKLFITRPRASSWPALYRCQSTPVYAAAVNATEPTDSITPHPLGKEGGDKAPYMFVIVLLERSDVQKRTPALPGGRKADE